MVTIADQYVKIAKLCEKLNIELSVDELAQISKTNKGGKKSINYLYEILEYVNSKKQKKIIDTLHKFSRIPNHKTLENFDFSFQPSIRKEIIEELATLRFVHASENVILIGAPGLGKSHLGIALGEECIQHGLKTYFITLRDLIDKLIIAEKNDKYNKIMGTLSKPSCLIIDEVGYQKLGLHETELFFELVSKRYEKGSIIITSNFPLSNWNDIFYSEALTRVIVDRLLHHSTVIKITGQKSYRLKDKLKQPI